MIKGIILIVLTGFLTLTIVGESEKRSFASRLPTMKDLGAIPRITKEELKPMLEDPDVIILDVRPNLDWKESNEKIVGAFRESPTTDIRSWVDKYPKDKTIVLY